MKKTALPAMAFAAIVPFFSTSGCSRASAADHDEASADRQVELTIYKQDFALVRDSRAVRLEEGRTRLGLDNVSRALDPNSVLFEWDEATQPPEVVSSTYDLGIGNSESLLRRFMGKKVQMVWDSTSGREGEKIEGTLEVSDGGGFVLRSNGKYYVNPSGTIVAPEGEQIVTQPQLSAEVESPSAQAARLGVAYLSRGLSWSADYVASLSPTDDSISLECWASVTNQTGVSFPNAKITLMAGSPNRAAKLVDKTRAGAFHDEDLRQKLELGPGSPMRNSVEEAQASGELYSYPIKAASTVAQDQISRVKMLSAARVPVVKDYNVRLPQVSGWYSHGWDRGREGVRQHAQLSISFVNDKAANLGVPLPSGSLRIYDSGKAGRMKYVGADFVRDTPKDAKVMLTLSDVFDVYVEPNLVSYKRIDKRTVRKVYEVVIHNEKATDVTLRLVQAMDSSWKIVSESDKHSKLNAYTAQWSLRTPAGGERKLSYQVDLKG